jgi:predicted small lipoprotein YifL
MPIEITRSPFVATVAALVALGGCGEKSPATAPPAAPAKPVAAAAPAMRPVSVPKYDANAPMPGLAIHVVDELAKDVPELARHRERLLASERKATQQVLDAARFASKPAVKKSASAWLPPLLAWSEAVLGFIPSADAADGGNVPGYTIMGMVYSTLIGGVGAMVGKGELSSDFKGKDGSVDGSLRIAPDKEGRATVTVETKIDAAELFLKANSRLTITGSMCPDANGLVDFSIKLSSDGRAGSGGSTIYDRNIEGHVMASVDDDANLVNVAYQLDQSTRSTAGGRQVYVDTHQAIEVPRGEYGNMRASELKWRASSQANVADAQAAVAALKDAFDFALGAMIVAEHKWKSGECIEIMAASPGKVKPGDTSRIPVSVVVKADRTSVPAKVKVDLAGGKSVDPALIPKAPGEVTHVAPSEKKSVMKITLTATSRRGKDTKVLDLSAGGGAYEAEGGLDDFHGTGTICDLGKTFKIAGSGNTVTFEPTSEAGGNYSYQGTMSGFGVFGKGTYVVNYKDDTPVGITGTGVGSVKTPMGVLSNSGTEKYRLTPRSPC